MKQNSPDSVLTVRYILWYNIPIMTIKMLFFSPTSNFKTLRKELIIRNI